MDEEVEFMNKFLQVIRIVVLIYLCLTLTTNSASADHGHTHSATNELSQLADNIYFLVKNKNYEEASLLMRSFANTFSKIEEEDLSVKLKEMEMLALSFHNLEKLLKEEDINPAFALRQVTEFRFLLDAMMTQHQPLWVEKEEAVRSAFTSMSESLVENNNVQFQASLNELLSLYDLIYPALYVDLTAGQLEKVEMHVQFLDKYRTSLANDVNAVKHIAEIQGDFDKLFAGELEEDDANPSLIWVMFSVGSIIFASLCFVGWRKYKGEKIEKIKKVRDR
jgi:sporulation protein YpjB